MSNFLTLTPGLGGLQGTNPAIWSAVTTDVLTTVVAAGYLDDLSDQISVGDTIILCYAAGTDNQAVTFGYVEASGDDLNFVVGVVGSTSALEFQGTWDADTNTPTLVNPPASTTRGFYYIVSNAGTQFGITFAVNDWIVSNGSAWQKVDNTETDIALASAHIFVGNGSGIATDVAMTGDIGISNTGVTAIQPGVILDADVNASAAIAFSKLAPLTSANVLLGSAGNVATATALSGDVTVNNTGVTAIGAGVIVDADVNASAAIGLPKLAALTADVALISNGSGVIAPSAVTSTELGYLSGVTSAIQTQIDGKATSTLASANIFVGSAGNVATAVAVTGDIGISNTGVTAIGAGVVVDADVNASAAIAFSKLAALPAGNIIVGSVANVPTSATVTGDITISDTAVAAIAAGVIVDADINASAAIAISKLATPLLIPYTVETIGNAGGATFSVNITGMVATDRVAVTLTAATTIFPFKAVANNGNIALTFTADPGVVTMDVIAWHTV